MYRSVESKSRHVYVHLSKVQSSLLRVEAKLESLQARQRAERAKHAFQKASNARHAPMQPVLGHFAVSSSTALQQQKEQPQAAASTGKQHMQLLEHPTDEQSSPEASTSQRSELCRSQIEHQAESHAPRDSNKSHNGPGLQSSDMCQAHMAQQLEAKATIDSDKSPAGSGLLPAELCQTCKQQSQPNAAKDTDESPAGSSVLTSEEHSSFLHQQLVELQAAKAAKQQQLQATIDKCKKDKEELESGVNRKISALEQKYHSELETAQQKSQQKAEGHQLKMAELRHASEHQQRDADRRVNLIIRAKQEALVSTDALLQEMLHGLSDPTR